MRTETGAPPIRIIAAEEALEGYDLAELVDVGVIPAVILDRHKAELCAQTFEHLIVHENLTIKERGEIAWAVRKGSPRLLEATDAFVAKARKGTELGNILYRRWIADPTRVVNAIAPGKETTFVETIGFIRRHATAYDFDPGLDQSERSAARAIRIMQLMPATARDPDVGIPDIDVAERNVEAGVKYLRPLRSEYSAIPPSHASIKPPSRLRPTMQVRVTSGRRVHGPRSWALTPMSGLATSRSRRSGQTGLVATS